MNVKRLRTSIAAAMGGAVLLAGLLVGASFALAQETEEPEVTVAGDALNRGFHLFRDGARMVGGHLDRIAEELGTTPEELRDQLADGATLEEIAIAAGVDLDALFEELRLEALAAVDQQVVDGNITQEQADRIKERIESFEPGDGFFGGHRGLRGGMPGLGGFFGDLDLDLEELGELMESGMSLDEALDSMGVDVDALVAEATAEALARIDELVAEGELTQEQADRIKERIESFEPGDGFFGGHRGLRGGMPGLGGFFGDLDLDMEELGELMESGMSLDEALDSMGVDVDALVAEATAEALARIDALVADGELTQERADRIKERIETMDLSDGLPLGLGGFRFPPDGFGGHRGPGFGFFGDDGANVEEARLDA